MSQSPFPGPIAPENNPPINPQFFQPSVFTIAGITLGSTTIVTTSVDHNYVVGQQVRLLIPFGYGSYQLNEQTGLVIFVPSPTQVQIQLNSTNSSPFVANPSFGPTPPQIVAIGDTNSGQINSSGRINNLINIPGSFNNISP